jgi:hypothetical protein
VNYVYLLDPNDQEFRKIKAGALTQDGSALDGSVSRCPLWFEAMHEEISAPFLRRLIHPAILFLHICGVNQVYLTPGWWSGASRVADGMMFTTGVGYQIAVAPNHHPGPLTPAYSNALVFTSRFNF